MAADDHPPGARGASGSSGTTGAFVAIVRRDVRAALRRPGEAATPVVFFVVVAAVFPLATGAGPAALAVAGPGALWIAALLAALLSLDRLFREDLEDGSLDQLLLSPHPTALLAAGRIAAHWLVTGLPLLVASLPVALLLALPLRSVPILLAAFALGTATLSLAGAIGAALTAGARGRSLLLPLIALPLLVPVLIFGTLAVRAAALGVTAAGPLYLLAALFVLAATLAPFATGAALTVGAE